MSALKPSTPRVYHRQGAPAAWFLMGQPRRTYPSDTGDVADLTGSVPAGVRTSACTWAAGPRGSCLAINGDNTTVVQFPAVSATGLVGDFTFMTWGIETGAGGAVMAASTQNDYHDANGWTTYHSPAAGGIWDFLFFNATFFRVNIGIDGRWHHYAITGRVVSGSTILMQYFDGVPVNAGTATGVTIQPTTHPLMIGRRDYATYDPVRGSMDDVRFYGRALSAAEIAREYADPYWRLRPPSRAGRLAATFGPRFHPWWLTQSPVLGSGVY
jgi:hypothetical protein